MDCENSLQLSQHVRENHFRNQVSQTVRSCAEASAQTDDDSQPIDDDDYPCFYCGQTLSTLNLNDHSFECQKLNLSTIIEPNVFPCEECGITTASMEELLTHMNAFHPVTKQPSMYLEPWPCNICDLKCNDMLDLERHKTSSHQQDMIDPSSLYNSEEDLKCCDFCGRQFGTLGCLRNHIRSLHREMLPT